MKILPSNLRVAGISRDVEPQNRLGFCGGDKQGVDHDNDSSTKHLPPLAIESSAFRGVVWAQMDPCRRGRLNLEDFEDRLNALPLETADNVSSFCFSWFVE